MQQVSRGFSWKRLYHYLSICLLTSEQYAPRVLLVVIHLLLTFAANDSPTRISRQLSVFACLKERS
jgi:hypothetical protein